MNNALERFLKAQERVYEVALKELKDGEKINHWMWYIFPQLRGLGKSNTSFIYGIINISEAKEYLAHPVLGERLTVCCESILVYKDKTAKEIFGYIDDEKLRSCMTLFALISEENSVFHKVLNQFFDGKTDAKTESLISEGFNIKNGELLGYYGEEENLTIPEGVTSIHKLAFYKNKYLRSVVLPESLESIGDNAFSCCYNLQEIVFPKKTISIGRCAFSCCEKLSDNEGFLTVKGILYDCYNTDENIVVPEGVTEIEEYAFTARNKTLRTLILPESVAAIKSCAFWRCRKLESITIPASVTAISLSAFKECENFTIYAPAGSYAESYAKYSNIHCIRK